MRQSSIPEKNLLPYETIVAATRGEPAALGAVQRHFEGYISAMSTRIFFDEFGQSYRCVDQELRRRIENKLTARILQKFKPV